MAEKMVVVFVHGWSVTDTSTYGALPEALAAQAGDHGLELDIQHIWLGKYVSFHDEVSMADVARAFNRALLDRIPGTAGKIRAFSCVTHSTGGPVVREWLNRFYGADDLAASPMNHLVMLAPANHGSALAALGKARVGRIKAWFSGVEPGQRILDWLSLGSRQSIALAKAGMDYKIAGSGFYPFVLTGQSIDKKFYDFINSYLVEPGSDGVVRVAAANMNYSMIRLKETDKIKKVSHGPSDVDVHLLAVDGDIQRPDTIPLGVVPLASHSGDKKGIMGSVLSNKSSKAQVGEILKCFTVGNDAQYQARADEMKEMSEKTQKPTHKYAMLVFIIKDDQGDPVKDYDLFLLGGDDHDPDKLSKGFFVDRQQNAANPNQLVYYVDYDVITKNKLTGFRVVARPEKGFAFYHSVEYRSPNGEINDALKPNETFYVEIQLHRCVDKNVFGFDKADEYPLKKKGLLIKSYTRHSFKDIEPDAGEIDS